jgi:hypothetical protein
LYWSAFIFSFIEKSPRVITDSVLTDGRSDIKMGPALQLILHQLKGIRNGQKKISDDQYKMSAKQGDTALQKIYVGRRKTNRWGAG